MTRQNIVADASQYGGERRLDCFPVNGSNPETSCASLVKGTPEKRQPRQPGASPTTK